ncbi:MAG: hypothetical protein M3R68_11175 [Acidobacteriota bacterium]|nr:hypothetical protein [Acidobacteriota bacterium]
MTEHLTEQTIEHYRRRQVEPVERQRADAHLAQCEACVKRILDGNNAALAFDSLGEAFTPATNEEPFHLSSAELMQFASKTASEADKIICESHLEHCPSCNRELRLLSAAPAEAPATRTNVTTITRARSQMPQWSTPARVAAVLALVALLLLVAVLWRQTRSHEDSVRNTPSPAPTPFASPIPSIAPSVEATPPATALLKDNGTEIRLDQDGKLIGLEKLDETTQQMAKAALAGENLTRPKELEGLSSPRIKLLGEPPGETTFRLVSPLGQMIIEDHPTLKWRPLAGATGYVVTVFDKNFNRVAQSPPLSKTEWTLAAPLARGGTFLWEVTTTVDGNTITAPAAPAPRAQFRVIESDKLGAWIKLKQQQPASHLALGLGYARLGLLNDAEREFRQLVNENPDSAIARKLLRTVQMWHNSK